MAEARTRRGGPILLVAVALLAFAIAIAWTLADRPEPSAILQAAAYATLRIVSRLRDAGPLGVVGFLALHLMATLLAVPGSWPQMAAGFLFGPMWGAVIGSFASTACATVAFGLARTWLRGPIERRLAHDVRFRAIDAASDHGGAQLVALLRLSPVAPFSVITYLLGLTRVRLRDFVLGSWLGNLPSVLLYAWIGGTAGDLAALLEGRGDAGSGAVQVISLVLTLVASAAVARFARRAIRDALASEAPT